MAWDRWQPPLGGWPEGLWRVPYRGAAIPGASEPASWLGGSNCQRFAYGVLALFDHPCPPLRSSDLWADQERTATIEAGQLRPLDLVLYNRDRESYGAHVGVWMAPGEILHLCAEVGVPAVWSEDDFALRGRYATVVGYKRVRAGAEPTL
jgi:cell wall-associated NlpC family hydrolase